MTPRDLSALGEYRAGRGVEEVARELSMDPDEFTVLSSNENAHGPSPEAVDALREAAARAHRYPKSSHADLTDALASHWDVPPEQVWLAAGGVGALDYLARAFLEPGDSVLVSRPGFPYHARSARFHHGRVNTYPLEKSADFEPTAETVLSAYSDERIVYLTSPHNPTGRRTSLDTIGTIAREVAGDSLVLVDEAYGEYSDGPSAVELLDDYGNVAVMRTLSKAYGLAGCRVGYAVVPAAWGDVYSRVTTPFAASELACLAGLAALDDQRHVRTSVETAQWAREYLHRNLDARTWESQANFVLADVGDATRVASTLERRGIVVRDCTGFGLPGCVRITTGTREETRRAVRIGNEVLAGDAPE